MKKQFNLENGIPVTKIKRGRPNKYPFATMRVGNSFLTNDTYSHYNISKILAAARTWSRTNGKSAWKFSARKTKDNEIRIWRMK